MPATEVQDLHVANSINELNDKSEVDIQKKNVTSIQLSRSAAKLFESAERKRLDGDEENAYILYMKYLNVVKLMKDTHDYRDNKITVMKCVGKDDVNKALDYATKIKESLVKRYDDKRLLEKLDEYENQNIVKQKIETDRERARKNMPYKMQKISNFPVFDMEPPYKKQKISNFPKAEDKTINVMKLYKLLEDKSTKIMILDTRPSADYKESHMSYHMCVNVPQENIVQGYTPDRIIRSLPHETIIVWNKRKDVDLMVLLDWASITAEPGTCLEIFQSSILKWDIEVEYKRKPIILEGGYEAWLSAYPIKTTNPHVTPPGPNTNLDDLLNDIDYPSLIDTPTEKKPSSIQNGLPSPTPQVNRVIKKPVVTPSNNNPMVDRSKKAAALEIYNMKAKEMKKLMEQNEKLTNDSFTIEKERIQAEETWEKIHTSHEKEPEEGEKETLQLKQDELQSLLLQLESRHSETILEIEQTKRKLEEFKKLENSEVIIESNEPTGTESSTQVVTAVVDPAEADEAKKAIEEALERKKKIMEMEHESAELAKKRKMLQIERERKLAEARANKKPWYELQEETENEEIPLGWKDESSSIDFNRSQSTPNIAQLDENEVIKATIPAFDRAAKPSYKTTPYNYSQVRHRDFQGVFGCPGHGLTGLKNLGNTCYMNSIMQCLSNTVDLADYFRGDMYRNDVRGAQICSKGNSGTRGAVAEEVAAVVKALWSGQFKFISAKDLRNVVGKHQVMFRGFEQQDSHEFLTILMDWLHNDLQTPTRQQVHIDTLPAAEKAWLEYTKSKESLILKLFYGQIKSTLTCLTCGNKSITHDSFSNLSLELPTHSNKCSLSNCLDLYLQDERISDWNCPHCKQKRDAVKKLDISRLPPILVIHFKRFYVDPKDYMGNSYKKKLTNIDFPLSGLDMGKFSEGSYRNKNSMYNLYGVSNHYGSMEGGHYTAYCKSSVNLKWYKFDDHVVTDISPSDVKSSAAYILFYSSLK